MNIRRLPILGLLLDPTPADFDKRRLDNAQKLAEHHRQEAQNAADSAAWHLAQQEHHKRMEAVYAGRLS